MAETMNEWLGIAFNAQKEMFHIGHTCVVRLIADHREVCVDRRDYLADCTLVDLLRLDPLAVLNLLEGNDERESGIGTDLLGVGDFPCR